MSENLVRYDAARRALAEARRVDEVKNIRDKAKAMQVYAQQAQDSILLDHATDIRFRAEIRAGELLDEMKVRGERAVSKDTLARGRTSQPRAAPKLADLGVSKTQSSRWQRLAKLAPKDREARIEAAKQKAVAALDSGRKHANGARRKSSRYGLRRGGFIALADRCAMAIRPIVVEAVRKSPPNEWAALFAALRDELDDIEKTHAKEAAR